MNYSQLCQDIDVISFYKYKTGGYFVDIGANDGIKFSNTFLLETKYNWKGICAETDPRVFNFCKKNRINSICTNKAVYKESNIKLKFNLSENSLLSGLTDFVDCHTFSLQNSQEIVVDTISLTDLLNLSNAPSFIEYLTIDTEGSELEILKGCDFNKYSFGTIHIEHNFQEPRRTEMRLLLEKNGYKFLKENKWDDYYVLKTLV